MDYFLAG